MKKSKTGSLRYNSGKPEVTQLDPRFILALADHFTQSSKKYGLFNYALGQEYRTPADSLARHLLRFLSGEDLDEDGKCNILGIAANAMILWTSKQLKNKKLDNRYPWEYRQFLKDLELTNEKN